MTHAMVTSAIAFPRDHADAVDAALAALVPELRSGGEIRNALRGKSLHFMTITVVRGDGEEPTHLVFEINADGRAEAAYALIESALGQWVTPLLKIAGVETAQPLAQLLAAHRVHTGTGLFDTPGVEFCGTPGMSADRICAEYDLARAVRTYFDAHPLSSEAPLAIVARARAHIAGIPALQSLLTAPPLPVDMPDPDPVLPLKLIGRGVLHFLWPVLAVFGVLVAGAVAIAGYTSGVTVSLLVALVGIAVATVGLVGLIIYLYFSLRGLEAANTPDDSLPDPQVMAEVVAHENWSQQNHLAGVSVMQAGRLRELTLRLAFWVIGQMVARKFRPGFLGELSTIHFARWVRLPGTNKLLFFSNYGGSWESYLEDFITRASEGLTAVWGNTAGFPWTRNLFMGGATDGDRFKRWARRQQQPTRFWYSAYPHLTTARIRTNAAIRRGLACLATQDEATAWLALFGSRPRPDAFIETSDIQTLLFGGLSRHPEAACLALELPANAEQARAWLRLITPQITFGDQPPEEQVLILALAAGGLDRLGLSAATQGEFPMAYRMGMSHPVRADILADTGEDKPQDWLWGGPGHMADAALLVYARDAQILEATVAALKMISARKADGSPTA